MPKHSVKLDILTKNDYMMVYDKEISKLTLVPVPEKAEDFQSWIVNPGETDELHLYLNPNEQVLWNSSEKSMFVGENPNTENVFPVMVQLVNHDQVAKLYLSMVGRVWYIIKNPKEVKLQLSPKPYEWFVSLQTEQLFKNSHEILVSKQTLAEIRRLQNLGKIKEINLEKGVTHGQFHIKVLASNNLDYWVEDIHEKNGLPFEDVMLNILACVANDETCRDNFHKSKGFYDKKLFVPLTKYPAKWKDRLEIVDSL